MLLGSLTYSNAQSIGSLTKAAEATATKQATVTSSFLMIIPQNIPN